MNTANSFAAVVLLLAANGFYVAAEFALVKVRHFRIESRAVGGSAAARLTLRIRDNLEAHLAACQIGITMASLGLGWVGEPAVAALLEPLLSQAGLSPQAVHTSAFIVGFLVFSALHIVVGEQVPKTFAIRKPEPVSLWVAYPLYVSYLVTWPLSWLLNRATGAILRWFRIAEASHAEVLSSEEIRGLVTASSEHGEIHHKQAAMLHNLFEFDLRHVGRIMIPVGAVHTLDLGAAPEENLRQLRETGHSRFPLVDGRDDHSLLGIVLAKDIHQAVLDGEPEPWRDLARFCRESLVVPETQRVARLFEMMRKRRAHMTCVVDEYGVFIGVITLEDLIEEIVGEIHDETDDEQVRFAIKRVDDATWEVDGLASLTDLERVTGVSIDPALDANTLSGLLMQRLARMPAAGDRIEEPGFTLEVLEIEEHRVGKVRLTRTEVAG